MQMDVKGYHIGKWHQKHKMKPAFSGELILVDPTPATRCIQLYCQQ